jgi:hypothetical protein
MGAEPYHYLVDYQEDIAAALAELRKKVFNSKEFFGSDLNPNTPEEALELTQEEGTKSILDIMSVADEPAICSVSPLSADEMARLFRTQKPTVEAVMESSEFWDSIGRGTARYVVIWEGDVRKKIFFAGYSFD